MTLVLLVLVLALLVVLHRQIHRLNRAVHRLAHKENIVMSLTEDLIAAVEKNTTAVGSVIEYLKSLPPNTTVAEAIVAMNANADALNSAIPANL